MARKFNQLPSWSNVAPGSTATLQIPIGVTYDSIHIKYSGVTLAQLKNLELRINGKVVQSYIDAVRLQDINKHYKRNIKTGVLTLHFVRPEMDNVALRRMTALGTADVSTLDIRVDIDAATLAPVLEAHAIKSPQSALGMITKVKRFPASSATSGLKEIDNIPKEGRLAAVHFFKADISKVQIEADSVLLYDVDKTLAAGYQVDHGRNPNALKHTTVDFHLEGDPTQALIVEGVRD